MKSSPAAVTSNQGLDKVAIFHCLVALFFWTAGPLFIRYLADYLDGWTQNALRYSFAALVWLPFLFHQHIRGLADTRVWKKALIPWIPNVCMQVVWAFCFYYAGPALIVLLTKTNVLWITGLSMLFFVEERPLARSRRFWLGFVFAICGLIGVVWSRGDLTDSMTTTGIFLALLTAFFTGLYTVSVRFAFHQVDSRLSFSVLSIYTSLTILLGAALFGDLSTCANLGPKQWFCIIISGATALGLGHVSYYAAIRRLGATIPALVILAQPFTVLIGSHLIFKESIKPIQILFGCLLLVGAGFAILAQRDLRKSS